jgi:hypothetical protein
MFVVCVFVFVFTQFFFCFRAKVERIQRTLAALL